MSKIGGFLRNPTGGHLATFLIRRGDCVNTMDYHHSEYLCAKQKTEPFTVHSVFYERLLDFPRLFSERNSCKQSRNLALLSLDKN